MQVLTDQMLLFIFLFCIAMAGMAAFYAWLYKKGQEADRKLLAALLTIATKDPTTPEGLATQAKFLKHLEWLEGLEEQSD